MQRITPGPAWPLHDAAATRAIEAASAAGLPLHTLMQRAGAAVARLALALAPHARTVWVACGPGNNGGDGLEAAMRLRQWGGQPVVTWEGDEARAPADARASLQRAREAGVAFAAEPPPAFDLAIDALYGLGSRRSLEGCAAHWAARMARSGAPVLAVDLPSGLDADTGTCASASVQAHHTLSLLTLKPGLFTAQGRDASGQVWFDDLGVAADAQAAAARLLPAPDDPPRPHASHKGSWGDVAVIGGAPGMTGAALLAARAALHGGAGRVFVGLLDDGAMAVDPSQPELMLRPVAALDFSALHLACGCGGGEAVHAVLPRAVQQARSLVLDADALNALANDSALQTSVRARGARGRPTVLTPHPLEAARLLQVTVHEVQADRLAAARALADRLGAVMVLKGSGTVVVAADGSAWINPTGSARLATAGTGDVLAGMVAARMARGVEVIRAAGDAVFTHGQVADGWPTTSALTAGELARGLRAQ